MDVNGIYDRNPKEKNAKLIEKLNKKIEIKVKEKEFDVTGGIRNKIEQALKMPCKVYFINGTKKGNLEKAVKGEKIGTRKD